MTITYLEGDATAPDVPGLKIIAHCCNDIGAWGSGFVMALSKKWSKPEAAYRTWASQNNGRLPLGGTQFVIVREDIIIANIIGQQGIGFDSDGKPPIRYKALQKGFFTTWCLVQDFVAQPISIHMPRIGCGLAGGKWSEVEKAIHEEFLDYDLDVFVYDLPGQPYVE